MASRWGGSSAATTGSARSSRGFTVRSCPRTDSVPRPARCRAASQQQQQEQLQQRRQQQPFSGRVVHCKRRGSSHHLAEQLVAWDQCVHANFGGPCLAHVCRRVCCLAGTSESRERTKRQAKRRRLITINNAADWLRCQRRCAVARSQCESVLQHVLVREARAGPVFVHTCALSTWEHIWVLHGRRLPQSNVRSECMQQTPP